MSYSDYEPPCPAPQRVKRSWRHFHAIGRCDHCRQRFTRACFQEHGQTCPSARNQATLRLVLECCFCKKNAPDTCGWSNEFVCPDCFEGWPKTKKS